MSTSPPVTLVLAGQEYEIAGQSFATVAEIFPRLINVSKKMSDIEQLQKSDFEDLIEVIVLALQTRYPAITVERLRNEAITLPELAQAIVAVSKAIGLTDPPAPAAEPEALEPEPAHG